LSDFSAAMQALTLGGAGVWTLVFMLAITLIKGWPKLKAIQIGADDSLRHDLLAEITRLRAENTADRVIHDAKIAAIEVKHSAQLTEIGERHDRRIAGMEAEMTGLRSQMQQLVESAARSVYAPTTIAETIARAYPIPRDMQDNIDKLGGDEK
jgi:hypothetical protein